MKNCILFILLCFSISTFAQETNSPKKKLESGLTFSFNTNGIAPIPAFSLDNPAIIASASLVKGRFSYSPALAYGLDMKPWYIDNWFHYKWVAKPKFEMKTGINFSSFFTKYKLPEEEILKGERYFAVSFTGSYLFSPVSSLSFDYWNDNGLEDGSISGHFFDLVYSRSEIRLGEKANMATNLMLFYINYDGNNDGLFFSPTVAFSVNNIPVSLYLQATQVIDSNISELTGFRWNLGISYSL